MKQVLIGVIILAATIPLLISGMLPTPAESIPYEYDPRYSSR